MGEKLTSKYRKYFLDIQNSKLNEIIGSFQISCLLHEPISMYKCQRTYLFDDDLKKRIDKRYKGDRFF